DPAASRTPGGTASKRREGRPGSRPSPELLPRQWVSAPVGAVLELGGICDPPDVRSVAPRRVDVLVFGALEEEREDNSRAVGRPIRVEGKGDAPGRREMYRPQTC